MKVRASSLMYALLITLLIAVLSSMFISMVHLNHIRVEMLELRERLVRNASSALTIGMHRPDGPLDELIDLYEEETDSVQIQRKKWGVFSLLEVRAFHKQWEQRKIALVGEQLLDSTVLYLADRNRALNLTGTTVISGKAYLPPAGLKRAYIEGKNYVGDKLLYGEEVLSQKQLPSMSNIIQQLGYFGAIDGKEMRLVEEWDGAAIQHSFYEPTLYLYEEGIWDINEQLEGNIVLVSDSLIHIHADAQLENVLLFAPVVKVADQFQGTVQIFASDSVVIGRDCHFQYPSVVGAFHDNKEVFVGMGENSRLDGMIFINGKLNKRSFATHLFLDKKVEIQGQLYAAGGNVELRNVLIKGQSFVERFVLHTRSSVYENHLLDVQMRREALSSFFAVPDIGLSAVNHKTLVKWLR